MDARRRLRSALLAGHLTFSTLSSAFGAPPDDATRAEARLRFDRGLTLFNQGDNQGALAEFQRAFELTGNVTVLYNIARVQATAGEPVAAVETLERLLAAPGDLPAPRLEQARALKNEQQDRVGQLTIPSSVTTGARVEVDGTDVGALDPAKPIRLAAGRHVVGVLAPGHAPLRKLLLVAGQEQKSEPFVLEPLQGALGRVQLKVEPLDVQVSLDGQPLGKTPHLIELSLAPGRHRLKLERTGYRTLDREITVPDGGLLEIQETLAFDPASRAGHDGQLSVRVSEQDAVVFVNGAVLNEALAGIALPAGEHRLRVERAGFVTVDRTVLVPRASSAVVDVTLEPTADYRADFVDAASSRRAWALGVGIGGAVLGGASVGYLVYNGNQVSEAEDDFDEALAQADAACNPSATNQCDELTTIAAIREDDLGTKRTRQTFGWIGAGVGAAALGTGIVLWVTGDDPHRYDPRPESDVFGALDVEPWFGPDGGGLALRKRL
jgi:tetratricopeptide (TPR) repeat protein